METSLISNMTVACASTPKRRRAVSFAADPVVVVATVHSPAEELHSDLWFSEEEFQAISADAQVIVANADQEQSSLPEPCVRSSIEGCALKACNQDSPAGGDDKLDNNNNKNEDEIRGLEHFTRRGSAEYHKSRLIVRRVLEEQAKMKQEGRTDDDLLARVYLRGSIHRQRAANLVAARDAEDVHGKKKATTRVAAKSIARLVLDEPAQKQTPPAPEPATVYQSPSLRESAAILKTNAALSVLSQTASEDRKRAASHRRQMRRNGRRTSSQLSTPQAQEIMC